MNSISRTHSFGKIRSGEIIPGEPVSPKKKAKISKKVHDTFEKLKIPIDLIGSFLASDQVAFEMEKLTKKITAQFQSTVGKISTSSSKISGGAMLYTAHFLTGIGTLLGGAASIISLVKAGQMVKKGVAFADHSTRRSHREFGKSLVRKGVSEIGLHSASLLGGAVGLMDSAAKVAILIQPVATTIATPLIQVGAAIAAPLSLCLAGYGAKVNIEHISRTSAQLQFLREERDRLNELKNKMQIHTFTNETVFVDGREVNLKEREEIVSFALRRVRDRRIVNIASLITNSLYAAASILTVAALASGPGAAVLGTIALVLVGAGALGTLLTRGILAALHKDRKTKQIKKMRNDISAPRYISSKEMLAKANEILSTDPDIPYKEKKSVDKMSNGELLTFLIKGTDPLPSQDMREAFLLGQKHYWSKAFS